MGYFKLKTHKTHIYIYMSKIFWKWKRRLGIPYAFIFKSMKYVVSGNIAKYEKLYIWRKKAYM